MAGEGEKQLGQGTPEEKDKTPEKEPQKPEKGVPIDAGDEKEEQPEKKEEISSDFDLKAELEEVRNLSNQDLMARLFEKLQKFLKRFSDGSLEQLFGLGGPMFSKKEVQNIKVDVDKAQEQFEAPEKETNETKVVKFVCDALNLPVKKDVNALWFSLQNSEGITYEKNKDLFTDENVKEGDVLFFRKEEESTPYLTAIVSKVGPPIMMKYVDESGSVKEEDVLKSDLYAKEWFGFMKIPHNDEKKDEEEEVKIEKVEKQ
ncbi:hypothetical protein KC725_03990 [Candidatus Peregrinibacteria bacterium]|nr:hypothetical protein [Candidatus Peregrinibacteria bacterium]